MEEETKPFELGPLQKEWIQFLRDNPNLQITGKLGTCNAKGNIKGLCCLGAAQIIINKHENIKDFFDKYNTLLSIENIGGLDDNEKNKIGLKTWHGGLSKPTMIKYKNYNSLVDMNDKGLTWPEIADFIETNPKMVFTHPV